MKSSYDATKTILKHNDSFMATPVLVDEPAIVNDEGKYIVKAGTVVRTARLLDNPTEPVVEKNTAPTAASVELEIDATRC